MLGSQLLLASLALGLASAATLPNLPSKNLISPIAKRDGNCNTADNRRCWRSPSTAEPQGFSIDTDAESVWPSNVSQGQATKTFAIEISEKTLSPDGTPKLLQVINGVYPGPVIEAGKCD